MAIKSIDTSLDKDKVAEVPLWHKCCALRILCFLLLERTYSMTTDSSTFFNPLAIAFGVFLRKRRNNLPVDQISQHLSITSSFYRMIERGKANLNSSRALRLLELEGFDDIRFDQLSRLLILINITDGQSSYAKYSNQINLILAYDEYNDMGELFGPVKRTIDKYDVITQQELEEFDASNLVRKFLSTKPLQEGEEGSMVVIETAVNQIRRAPGLLLDSVFDLIGELEYVPRTITIPESQLWESKKKQSMKSLLIVSTDHELITNQDNFKSFNYEYLILDSFIEINMLFVCDLSSAEISKVFFANLTNSLSGEVVKKKMARAIEEKVKIKTVPYEMDKSGNEIVPDSVANILEFDAYDSKMVWVYEMLNDNVIGFHSPNTHDMHQNGQLLSLHRAYSKKNEIELLINEL